MMEVTLLRAISTTLREHIRRTRGTPLGGHIIVPGHRLHPVAHGDCEGVQAVVVL
jgi:hypothetical protein